MVSRLVHWCSICGRQKGATNHWFMAILDKPKNLKIIKKWRESKACEPHTLTICGEQCAHTLLSRWLSGELRLEAQSEEGTVNESCVAQQQ